MIDAIKDGAKEYRELEGELKGMKITLDSLTKDANNAESLLNRNGASRRDDLVNVISGVGRTIQDLETLVKKHLALKKDQKDGIVRVWSAYKVGSEDLSAIRGKLTFHTSTINLFLTSLEGTALGRMEKKLDRVCGRFMQEEVCEDYQSVRSAGSTQSVLSCIDTQPDEVWRLFKEELQLDGVPLGHLLAYQDDIIQYVRRLDCSRGMLDDREIGNHRDSSAAGIAGIPTRSQIEQPRANSNESIWISPADKSMVSLMGEAIWSSPESQQFNLGE